MSVNTLNLILSGDGADGVVCRLERAGQVAVTQIRSLPFDGKGDPWLTRFMTRWSNNDSFLELDDAACGEFGQRLYNSLLHGPVGSALTAAIDGAEDSAAVRLLLQIEDRRLHAIPFELLHDGQRFISPGSARLLRAAARPASGQAGFKPLRRILVVLAEPKNSPWGRSQHSVNLKRAFSDLETAPKRDGDIVVDYVEPATLEVLTDRLDRAVLAHRPYDAAFIVAHGQVVAGESAKLALETEAGETDWVDSGTFAQLFRQHPGCFIMLHACSSSAAAFNNPAGGLAQSLMQDGRAGAVLAMQRDVLVTEAIALATSFFRRIRSGDVAETAFFKAIGAITQRRDKGVCTMYTHVQGAELETASRIANLLNLDEGYTGLDIILPHFKMGLLDSEYEGRKAMSPPQPVPLPPPGTYHYPNLTVSRYDLWSAWAIVELFQQALTGLGLSQNGQIRFRRPGDFRSVTDSGAAASHVLILGSRSQELLSGMLKSSKRFKFDYSDADAKWTLTDLTDGKAFSMTAPQEAGKLADEDYLLIEKLRIGAQTFVIVAGFTDEGTFQAGKTFNRDWKLLQRIHGGGFFQKLYRWKRSLGSEVIVERPVPADPGQTS